MTSLHTQALGSSRTMQLQRTTLTISARHPGARRPAPDNKASVKPIKKRDISTSFRRGPVPRPLINAPASSAASTQEEQQAAQDEEPLLGMPRPLHRGLGSLRAEPVVAAASMAAAPIEQLPGVSSLAALPLADAAAEALLWASSADASVVDPLASMDRVLSSLIVAPSAPGSSSGSSAPASGSKKGSSSSVKASSSSNSAANTAELAATARAALSASKAQHALSAIAAPAVTVIHSTSDYDRELAAAAALNQLLVVKTESSRTLLQGGLDSSLRFQTNSNLPTALNTYLPPNESHTPLGLLGGSSSKGSGSLVSTAEVLHSLGFPVGFTGFSASANSSSSSSSGFASSSSNSEPFSPVHAWYKQLATKYAHSAAAAKAVSPIRFLSLQSDSAPTRAVCRRLGVSAGLSVVLVDAAKGRRVQEVFGTKIEQELPNGLLYFGGSDPQGLKPADRLAQLNSQADLDALRSSAQLAVVSLQMHAAPPCIRAYARLYAVAQQHSGAPAAALAFGVMDVDASPECGAVGTQLGLEQLPTYVIYKNGVEVERLGTSPDRRRLGEVVAQHMAKSA